MTRFPDRNRSKIPPTLHTTVSDHTRPWQSHSSGSAHKSHTAGVSSSALAFLLALLHRASLPWLLLVRAQSELASLSTLLLLALAFCALAASLPGGYSDPSHSFRSFFTKSSLFTATTPEKQLISPSIGSNSALLSRCYTFFFSPSPLKLFTTRMPRGVLFETRLPPANPTPSQPFVAQAFVFTSPLSLCQSVNASIPTLLLLFRCKDAELPLFDTLSPTTGMLSRLLCEPRCRPPLSHFLVSLPRFRFRSLDYSVLYFLAD